MIFLEKVPARDLVDALVFHCTSVKALFHDFSGKGPRRGFG